MTLPGCTTTALSLRQHVERHRCEVAPPLQILLMYASEARAAHERWHRGQIDDLGATEFVGRDEPRLAAVASTRGDAKPCRRQAVTQHAYTKGVADGHQ